MLSNEPSSGQRDKTLSRFKKWLREKYPRVYGFFFSETPFYIRHFFLILVLLGVIGGVAALLIPSNTGWLRQSGLSGEAEQKSISDLRLHFLYITGGIIAILTLLQTNWKNQVDRRKVEADIKKNEQDAEKNERDHIRQVHAERRSRYTKAVEQLANEKAAVRLGGIYTLVSLVDEWLADDTLESEEQQKEGQVIINNLCSYIRSPFPLALKAEMFEGDSEPDNYEGDFSKDQAAFHEEQDVRRTVFVEMSKRSSTFTRDMIGKIIGTSLGTWSDFEFDFSRASIFYPLSNLTIEKGNFSSAKFYSNADFSGAKFIQNADFSMATSTQNANFRRATFAQNADFSWAKFTQNADFIGVVFIENADFNWAKFTQNANFSEATFTQNADFNWAKFTQNANFSEATFTQNANFNWAKFTQNANFSMATFTQNTRFLRTIFFQNANFQGAYFKYIEPVFAMENLGAFFSVLTDSLNYVFMVNVHSPLSITPEQVTVADGRVFTIPVGCELFDPEPLPAPKPKEPTE